MISVKQVILIAILATLLTLSFTFAQQEPKQYKKNASDQQRPPRPMHSDKPPRPHPANSVLPPRPAHSGERPPRPHPSGKKPRPHPKPSGERPPRSHPEHSERPQPHHPENNESDDKQSNYSKTPHTNPSGKKLKSIKEQDSTQNKPPKRPETSQQQPSENTQHRNQNIERGSSGMPFGLIFSIVGIFAAISVLLACGAGITILVLRKKGYSLSVTRNDHHELREESFEIPNSTTPQMAQLPLVYAVNQNLYPNLQQQQQHV